MLANNDDRYRANSAKLKRLMQILRRLPPKALQRGFYGVVRIEGKIQDGVLQDVSAKVEENLR
jgi:hypothetical protein